MRTLGLDISSQNTGWATADDAGLQQWGDIPPTGATHAEKLSGFSASVSALITAHTPDVILIEDVWVGKNVLTMKILSYYHGVVLAAAGSSQTDYRIFTPSKFRKILGFCHGVQLNVADRAAAKAAMQGLISTLYPATSNASEDAADACGIALAGHRWMAEYELAASNFVKSNPRVRSPDRIAAAAAAAADAVFQLQKKGKK